MIRKIFEKWYSYRLESPNPSSRLLAAKQLGKYGSENIVKRLLKKIHTQDLNLRKEIINSIKMIGGMEAIIVKDLSEKLKARIPTGKRFLKRNKLIEFLPAALIFYQSGFDFIIEHQEEKGFLGEQRIIDSITEDWGQQHSEFSQPSYVTQLFDSHGNCYIKSYGDMTAYNDQYECIFYSINDPDYKYIGLGAVYINGKWKSTTFNDGFIIEKPESIRILKGDKM